MYDLTIATGVRERTLETNSSFITASCLNLNPNQDIDKKECYFWLFVLETFTTYFAITLLLCQRLQVLELFVIVETFKSYLTSQLILCRGIQVVVCDMIYRVLSI
eukprot:sb/3477964/